MHKYVINDIWMALKLSSRNFFGLIILIPVLSFLILMLLPEDAGQTLAEYLIYFSIAMVPVILIQSIFIYLANRRYVIDLETGMITFPRSDIENSILAIILIAPYWNLMRTITIHASEVENLYLDTKRWSETSQVSNGNTASGKPKTRSKTTKHVRYNINLAGTFGSANLDFLERQKRDEVRNAIQQCIKQHSNINIDRKIAEFN